LTNKVGSPGVSERPISGEQLEQARRRRKAVIIGGLVVIGFAGGFITGFTEAKSLFSGERSWPPGLSIGLACAYLAAVIGGGMAISRQTDEFEQQTQYKAVAVAALAYLLVYPPWFLLWMADLAREPIHWVLFLIFWVALALASIFYRFR
jgi:hypothetical protein